MHDNELENARNILLLGDGNGRFSTHLLSKYPHVKLTSLDASEAMLKQARKRRRKTQLHEDRIFNIHQNILKWDAPRAKFDAVVAQFFFDGFSSADISAISQLIYKSLQPDGRLLVSEFHIPSDTRIGNWRARFTIGFLYSVFGLLTGLKIRTLADHKTELTANGFNMEEAVFLSQKTLVSQVFRKTSNS